MKVLVVGGAGYVGGALSDLLSKNSAHFAILDDLLYEDRFLKQVEFFRCDIRETQKVLTVAKSFDVVVWLAALVGDPLCALNPDLTEEINTNALIRFAEDYAGKIVFMSTCSVYGAQEGLLDESSPLNPLSIYAVTKLKSEELLMKKKPDSLIFRLGTLFGLSDDFARLRADLVLNVLCMRAAYASELTVFGGDQFRPLLHVKDVGRAILTGLAVNAHGVFNLHCENITIVELAKKIQQALPEVVLEISEQSFQDSRNYSVSSEKAFHSFGFAPQFDIDYGINEVLRVLKEGRFPQILDSAYSNADKMRGKFVPVNNAFISQVYRGGQ